MSNKVKKVKIHPVGGNQVRPAKKEDLPKEYMGDFRFYHDVDKPYYSEQCKVFVFKKLSMTETMKKIEEADR